MASTHDIRPGSAADRLCEAVDRAGAPICVGLDPVLERIDPAAPSAPAAFEAFTMAVLDGAAGLAPAVKFQSACFERWGSAGVAALERGMAAARQRGFIVILDAKRGDIGISAAHYAASATNAGADWVTVSPYLGTETIEPFLDAGLGVFALVRTSNPGSDELQSARLQGGATVAEHIAARLAEFGAGRRGTCGLSDVGAVVGATKAADAAALRQRMADQWFLAPGYGAQGAGADDLRPMLRAAPGASAGVLVTASRSIIYPAGSGPLAERVRAATAQMADEVRGVIDPA
ncbi:MAG: orotidine-5'-phosphate decarboxylase [Phycisphaerales bacterium JB039]